MVIELLQIILPVISFYDLQVGLCTGSIRPTYVFILQLRPIELIDFDIGVPFSTWATCISR